MTLIRKLIRTDGTSQELSADLSWTALKALMGAETIDTVALHHLGLPLHVMLVDDGGYEVQQIQHSPTHFERRPTRALKPVNAWATMLYHANCKRGTTHQIVGDVVVMPDEDFA
jgi:hypothetical protein